MAKGCDLTSTSFACLSRLNLFFSVTRHFVSLQHLPPEDLEIFY